MLGFNTSRETFLYIILDRPRYLGRYFSERNHLLSALFGARATIVMSKETWQPLPLHDPRQGFGFCVGYDMAAEHL